MTPAAVAPLPVLSSPGRAAAIAGVNSPLNGLSVEASADASVTVSITAMSGLLYADPGPGAVVGGGGSTSIWLAGAAAQVTAKLASLVAAWTTAGSDALAVTVLDGAGRQAVTGQVPITVYPVNNDAGQPGELRTNSGTITLESRTIDGLTLSLEGNGAELPPSLVLVNDAIGPAARIQASNPVDGPAPRIAVAGQVDLEGTVQLGEGAVVATIALGAVLLNESRIELTQSAAVVQGGGTLRNDGAIALTGGSPSLAVAITGAGTVEVAAGARLTLAGKVGAGQTIALRGSGDALILAAPDSMEATIAGFAPGDRIVLQGIAADAMSYAAIDATHGTLTLSAAGQAVAHLRLAGAPPGLILDATGDAATSITDAPTKVQGLAAPAPVDVYRFFDMRLGTELLTRDAGERDFVLAHRQNLVYEGVAMRSPPPLAARGPGDVEVYRFFDKVHGTRFFTASATERDLLQRTRPELALEPGATWVEHGARQAGDAAVFRFFDTTVGNHFYTADAGERAQLLATRPDFTDEGIAFYAPPR